MRGKKNSQADGENELSQAFFDENFSSKEAKLKLETAHNKFLSALNADQRKEVGPILQLRNEKDGNHPPRFDLKMIQRYVLSRVFDLGWTTERFGQFDRFSIGYHGREARKAERIGKKYQWIAYYEILAYIADQAKKSSTILQGEVFLYLTRPLMGDPTFPLFPYRN